MRGLGNYETMQKIRENIQDQMSLLKMQEAQNYISLITVKHSFYDYGIFGFSDPYKALNIVDKYITDRIINTMSESDKKKGKNFYDVLVDAITSTVGIPVKEIAEINFASNRLSFEIYFYDDKNNKLSIEIPNINDKIYDLNAQDIDIGFGYEDFCSRCRKLLDALDTTLYHVSEESEYCVNKKLVTSFPDKVSDLKYFKKKYEQYLLDKEGVVLC